MVSSVGGGGPDRGGGGVGPVLSIFYVLMMFTQLLPSKQILTVPSLYGGRRVRGGCVNSKQSSAKLWSKMDPNVPEWSLITPNLSKWSQMV